MKKKGLIILAVILTACIVRAVLYMTAGCGSINKTAAPVKTTLPASGRPESETGPALPHTWLELPGKSESEENDWHCITHNGLMEGRMQRNYTVLYDESEFASYWVAYPLCSSHTTTGREEIWGYDPKVPQEHQTSVRKGYGASTPTTNYPNNFYARGHQIPNADRNAVPQMQEQTYYSTNMTPQIQNGFNGGIWAKLEEAVRETIPEKDTLYIVTGATFNRPGENKSVKTIINKNDGKTLPVPNYYWKAVLKVKRDPSGIITDAITIGFWLPHDDLKGHTWEEYSVSVDQLETFTGFDLFVNLCPEREETAEVNSSWSSFVNFR